MRILKEQCRKIYFLAYLSFNSIQSLCHSLEKCYQLCPLCHCHLRLMYILSTILCYVFIASVFLVSTFYLQQIFRLQYAFFHCETNLPKSPHKDGCTDESAVMNSGLLCRELHFLGQCASCCNGSQIGNRVI